MNDHAHDDRPVDVSSAEVLKLKEIVSKTCYITWFHCVYEAFNLTLSYRAFRCLRLPLNPLINPALYTTPVGSCSHALASVLAVIYIDS